MWLGLACTCRLCCGTHEDPWTRERKEAWCDGCDDCCDCCDCCGNCCGSCDGCDGCDCCDAGCDCGCN